MNRRHNRSNDVSWCFSRMGTGLLLILLVLVAMPQAASAQDDGKRPKIVVAVLQSGAVPGNVVFDIQDLFLAALARYSGYELVDKQAVYETTHVKSDVDLLLCMNQADCIAKLHDEHQFEQYVLVKVEESTGEISFSATNFNYKTTEPLAFGDTYTVAENDVDGLIERAFAVAEEVNLTLVSTSNNNDVQPVGGCPEGCPENHRCVKDSCVEEIVEVPPEPTEGPDWLLITGYGLGGVGVVTGVLAIVFWVDAQSSLDDFSNSYLNNNDRYISNMTQKKGRESTDAINSSANLSNAMLWVAIPTLAAGAGLITWRLFFADEGSDASEVTGSISVTPTITPDGASVGASVTF